MFILVHYICLYTFIDTYIITLIMYPIEILIHQDELQTCMNPEMLQYYILHLLPSLTISTSPFLSVLTILTPYRSKSASIESAG
mgnify:CR=1 FL=1